MAKSTKKKIRMEFEIKASPAMLFNYISSPSGLSQWFCNDVDIYNNFYKFKWDGDESIAELLKKTQHKRIRYDLLLQRLQVIRQTAIKHLL